ncbi:MAG: DUF1330 domain-containing protein [Pseudomonadota bacterium]
MDSYLDPDRDRFQAFRDLPRDEPADMLNLVRLRKNAQYEDGRVATGAEAYKAYGVASAPIFSGVGGSIIWSGDPRFMVIGPEDEVWHVAFIARYPSAQAFLDMVYNPDYQAIVHHRQAAVETSRLIRMTPRETGRAFG